MPELTEQQIRQIVRDELEPIFGIDRLRFEKHIQILDARNIQLGRTTGTKFGTATDQKVGFYGTIPVDQPAAVSDPSGGGTQDAEARTAINAIIDRLQELGLIA